MTDNSLSKLLASFQTKCKEIVKNTQIQDIKDEKQVLNQLLEIKQQGQIELFLNVFKKIKNVICDTQEPNKQKNTQQNCKKFIPNLEKQSNFNSNPKSLNYKPNQMLVNLFGANQQINNLKNRSKKILDQEDKIQIINNLKSLKLKPQKQQIKRQAYQAKRQSVKASFQENQQITSFSYYCHMQMAPKKQKSKKIKSTRQYHY